MKKLIIIIIAFLTVAVMAERRYVSKTGSNLTPYTSWETAARSIKACMEVSTAGDTIFIGEGHFMEDTAEYYFEQLKVMVRVKRGVSIIGSGVDKTFINFPDDSTDAFILQGNNYISQLCFENNLYPSKGTQKDTYCNGLSLNPVIDSIKEHTIIENNRFLNLWTGIIIGFKDAKIVNNLFESTGQGIVEFISLADYYVILDNNIFINSFHTGIYFAAGANPIIQNNYFYNDKDYTFSILLGNHPSVKINNNLIVNKQGVDALQGITASQVPTMLHNNVVNGNFEYGSIVTQQYNSTFNNIVMNNTRSPWTIETVEGFVKDSLVYNGLWNNKRNYKYPVHNSGLNIEAYPMFVNDKIDSIDVHLQKHSPYLDAGHPNYQDKDGSRSDIGLYGGPFGESYTYLDEAPHQVINLSAKPDTNKIILFWNKNHEADLMEYQVYRSTVTKFIPSELNKITSTTDTLVYDTPELGRTFYYRVAAVDSQGNISPASEEAAILYLSADGENQVILKDYILYNAYPNPFNPSTRISVKLNKPGVVNLKVYNIQGELIVNLVNNENKSIGLYEYYFSPKEVDKTDLSSGIYFYRLNVLNPDTKTSYEDQKKIIYVK